MREFFHGWQRKAGVATLVMACLVTSVWLRSLTYEDTFRLSQHGTSEVLLISAQQNVVIAWTNGASAGKTPFWTSRPLTQSQGWNFAAANNVTIYFDLSVCGFGYNDFAKESWTSKPLSIMTLHFSYLFLVLPLTLISAYLILWPQRKRPDSCPQF